MFGVGACDGDDGMQDHSLVRGTRMVCCRLGIVVGLMIRPINTVPATRTPQNDSDGNALESLYSMN